MPKVVPEYKEKAKLRIIEAGARVFTERGYYKTKMDDIADVLGVSKGAIYQYFKSKEQLFFDVIEFILEFRKDEMMSIIESDNPMRIATGEFFDMKISRSLQTRSFGFDLFFEAARNETLRTRMTEIYEKAYNEFIIHVEDLKKQGVIKRDADVGVVWRGLVALRDGLISSILLGADTSDAKKTWETVAKILLTEIFA
ncbi:MAG: TetR/AcrR family transcriptional regulator [Candidatus Thorarchaeota archaeon]|jgi:AcrR family transcriptional regulator